MTSSGGAALLLGISLVLLFFLLFADAARTQQLDASLGKHHSALVQELLETNNGGKVPSSVTPVVIVPSLLGSKLQAQLHRFQSGHWYCWTEWREWFTIWVDFLNFIPPAGSCWFEQFALRFNATLGRSFSAPGVEVRPVDYGGVDGVTFLDDYDYLPMWNEVVSLLKELGWEVGKNLRAAPYDWRFGPETFAERDWPRLRRLIEETYTLNNNTRVAAVSLSMGGPYFLGFLNQQTQAWKDKYLHSYVSFDGAFGGSPSATSALVATKGYWAKLTAFPEETRALTQSLPSSLWMMPLAQVYGTDYVWVTTTSSPRSRNYTTADFAQLLVDAGSPSAATIYKTMQAQNWLNFEAPGVETHCFFGTGVQTPLRMTFNTTAFDTEPVETFGNGDGVVPEAGLRMLERWRGKQAQSIYSYPIQGLQHSGSVHNPQVLRMFIEILASHQ